MKASTSPSAVKPMGSQKPNGDCRLRFRIPRVKACYQAVFSDGCCRNSGPKLYEEPRHLENV